MTYEFTEKEISILRQLVDGIRISPRQPDAEDILAVSKSLTTKFFPERDNTPITDAEIVNS